MGFIAQAVTGTCATFCSPPLLTSCLPAARSPSAPPLCSGQPALRVRHPPSHPAQLCRPRHPVCGPGGSWLVPQPGQRAGGGSHAGRWLVAALRSPQPGLICWLAAGAGGAGPDPGAAHPVCTACLLCQPAGCGRQREPGRRPCGAHRLGAGAGQPGWKRPDLFLQLHPGRLCWGGGGGLPAGHPGLTQPGVCVRVCVCWCRRIAV
jgi:hypothetical protein